MNRKMFGTDGVRGTANSHPMTAEMALRLGAAAGRYFRTDGRNGHRVVIGKDTRLSGYMLENALTAGLTSTGMNVLLLGPVPTPAVGYLTRSMRADLGIMISASHNPAEDNGIKFFGPDGFKLADAAEERIEARLEETPTGVTPGRVRALHGTTEDYVRALQTRFAGLDLRDVKVVIDCANGSTFEAAPEIFRRLGAQLTVLADTPDGRNINEGCGSTHLETLAATVREGGHDLGFGFDGDGDRVLAVDRNGDVVDGDELIALIALYLRRQDRLPKGGVAVTVMTNYGFHAAMEAAGVEVAITGVGDRYVLEALRERGWALGGEQSGHIIDMGFVPSGDGVASALLTLEALQGGDLAEREGMRKLPQRLVNVPVPDRDAAMADEGLAVAVAVEDEALRGRGRVLVRPSGTEQLVRVMVEAPDAAETDAVCERLVAIVRALD